ncbi:MAG: efflux RND transporter periplasmic adaptor subunit [Alistipes sp.]|nr:efflux RND transporter periplasmic adaptor subunit [Alistipes sp.]
MDRKISPEIIKQRRKHIAIRLGSITAAVVLAVIFGSRAFNPAIRETSLTIREVDRGDIDIAVRCGGTLAPLMEEIISAPINSRILEVYKNAGEQVEHGEPVMKLELAEIETQYHQKLDEREIMASKLMQLRINSENSISELVMQQQVGGMQLRQFESELEGERHLHRLGAGTADKIRQAELAYEESKLRLEQLEQRIANERKNAEAELRVHELELSIIEKTIEEYARLMDEARITSPRDATLTFINTQIGLQVAKGERLAVIADLSRFKIEAEIAGHHRSKLQYGGRVMICLADGEQLPGTIFNINPAVTNGVIGFTAVPDDPDHPGLASGIKLDVDVVHGKRQDVLRLPPGKWYSFGRGDYIVWVVRNGKAEKRRIRTGDSSADHVEIIDGLALGDRVIINDMENYENRKSIKIK